MRVWELGFRLLVIIGVSLRGHDKVLSGGYEEAAVAGAGGDFCLVVGAREDVAGSGLGQALADNMDNGVTALASQT